MDDAARFDKPLTDEYSEDRIADDATLVISISEFTEAAFFLPVKGDYTNFSFVGRPYLREIYDTDANRLLLMAGRQVEKSTLLGNKMLSYAFLFPGFRALYVSPSHMQTKEFSRTRIQEAIETSKVLQSFTNVKLTANLMEKGFINRSKVSLRFAFLNADRCRGVPADLITIDEFQDVLLDNIPVIEECASHSEHRLFTYSGTPKSLDNAIEHYWSKFSTQNEWVIPCRSHGTPNDPSSWHWNVTSEASIGKFGLICDKCGKRIDPNDPDAQWASMNPNVRLSNPYMGYRIPQLIVSWIHWQDIISKYETYSRVKFYNEVLGRSFDSGTRPLTQQDVLDNCSEELSMFAYADVKKKYAAHPVFMGIDWGTGEKNSFTVILLGGYFPWAPHKFSIFYAKQCKGKEAEPDHQLDIILGLCEMFNVIYIGVDYGGGFYQNDKLVRRFGAEKICRYQWIGRQKKKVSYEASLGVPRFLCHRTEVMSDVFNAVKRRNVFQFPNWSEWESPFASDMLNIFSEYSETMKQNVYKRGPSDSDDTFHSLCYCFLASMKYKPRRDVILPEKTEDILYEGLYREELDIV